MIVKDEAKFIRQAIISTSNIADEIIVLDTGSTDDTVKIASNLGVTVHHFEWTGSFADARNESVKHATKDWVLILDADEEIAPFGMADYFNQVMNLEQEHPTAYQLRICNLHGDTKTEHFMPRFYRRDSGLIWQGFIHEQIVHETGCFVDKPTVSQIMLVHHGYEDEVMNDKDKTNRNLNLINKGLSDDPHDPFHWFNKGMVEYNQANWLSALEAFQQCIKYSDEDSHFIPISNTCLIAAFMEVGRIDEALTVAEFAPACCLGYPGYLNVCAKLQYSIGNLDESFDLYNMSLTEKPMDMPFRDPAQTTWVPLAGIGNVYLAKGDVARARKYFSYAHEISPNVPDLVRILNDLNNIDESE